MSSRRAPVGGAPASRLHVVLAAGHARRAATAPTAPTGSLELVPENQQRKYNATMDELRNAQREREFEKDNKNMSAWAKVTLDKVMSLFRDRRHSDPQQWQQTHDSIKQQYETLSSETKAALNFQRTGRAELMQELVTHLLELAHAWQEGTMLLGFPQSHNDYVAEINAKWSQLMGRLNELVEKREPGMLFMRKRLQEDLYPLIDRLPKPR